MTALTPEQHDHVMSCYKWAIKLANTFQRKYSVLQSLDRDDLIQESLLALCRCARQFKEERGKLTTVTFLAVKRHLLRYSCVDRLIKMPADGVSSGEERDRVMLHYNKLKQVSPDALYLMPARSEEEEDGWLDHRQLQEALRELQRQHPLRYEVLERRRQGWSYAMIANEYGIKEKRAYHLTVLAIKFIRKFIFTEATQSS